MMAADGETVLAAANEDWDAPDSPYLEMPTSEATKAL